MTTGTTMEVCGGLGYISIYNNTDPAFNANGSNENSAGAVKPVMPLSLFPSNYLGCATDQIGNVRALSGASTQSNNMSAEVCATFCQQGSGYQYYATEFATQSVLSSAKLFSAFANF